MSRTIEAHKTDLLDKVMQTACWRLGDENCAPLKDFLLHYYALVPAEDIWGESPDALFGAAYSHFRLAAQRTPGEPRIRVYNPRLEEHGWRCEHSVIEIVTDDMPFLVDSVTAEVNRRELAVHRVIHPLLRVVRDAAGAAKRALPVAADGGEGIGESFMHVEITRQHEGALADIEAGIASVLADVRMVVEDWQPMRERLGAVVEDLGSGGPKGAREEVDEVVDFLQWLREDNFTFLGYRGYGFERSPETIMARVVRDSGLGVLRQTGVYVYDDLRDGAPLPPAVRAFADRPEPMLVTKSNQLASVHRRVHMDAINIKRYRDQGVVDGEHIFIGLFASPAYNRSARNIPWLRRKVERVVARAGFAPRSHDARALMNTLETFPRDELFQVTEDHLLATTVGILGLQHSQRVALFIRRDDFERFIACLVYVPRDRYTTELRLKIQAILERAFDGRVTAHYGQVGDQPLARLQVYIKTTPGEIPEYDADEVQAQIAAAARTWADGLAEALDGALGEGEGRRLFSRYARAFPPGYRERFNGMEAVADVRAAEQVLETGVLNMSLYRPLWAGEHQMRFKVFHLDDPIPLSQMLPLLEHLGVKVIDEVPHEVRIDVDGGRTVMIHDFGLETQTGAPIELRAITKHFQDTFRRVWRGEVESDRFNGLVLGAGLSWRQVAVLRTYCKYLRQAGIPFSQAYMEATLTQHPALAGDLVRLFETLFDPRLDDRDRRAERLRSDIAARLEEIASADDDRILRRFYNAIESSLRTNYFQRAADGGLKPYISIKLDSHRVDDLPAPRPMVEVFVYAPFVEGIHLRGGKVARGGLRWSDRREDFRTEVLGLMKAQMVKNAVIVPVGSKGGFIVKCPPDAGDREAFMAEGVRCYRTFICGLLDVTDNLAGGNVVPPSDLVRRDGDDPYLVVAADKGTATFSDIANGISADYGFWLGDAFASGGSQGYDHKKMGITARGAWESVKRHFRETGVDIQAQEFTVVGVGDMSGDVFGNGMLLSPHIRLLAAFDHRHIFIDPDPDPAVSFTERQRLFDLPRSSWMDYDRERISDGGGVFDRRSKTLELGESIRKMFGIEAGRVTPNELIRAILKAEADLLWFGGIGTYVKSDAENNAEVGDRANDAVRVDASELRCKVIGEGANLALTQLGRIEFARAGGRINADFIDNSAGVDCSDHEVNIKILVDAIVADGDLTDKQRNALLAEMTDEVAQLVLRDNYLQSQAITLIEAEGASSLENQARLMRMLERQGRLDRAVEFLPNEEVLAERASARQALSRPEIATLFSYCKIWLYDQILASDLPDDRHLAVDLVRYFPAPVRQRFRDRIPGHRLRRELIATGITNSLVNRVGGTFVTEIMEKTAMPAVDIARAYIIARDVFSVREVWEQIEALDNRVPASVQTTLHRQVQRLLERATQWFLRNGGSPLDITVNVSAFDTTIAGMEGVIASVLPDEVNSRILHRAGRYRDDGVPEALARRVAYLIVMPSACDIVRLAAARGIAADEVARLYFAVGEQLGFGWLRYQAEKLVGGSYWQKMAVAAVVEELYAHQRDITRNALGTVDRTVDGALDAWREENRTTVDRTLVLLNELEGLEAVDLSMLTVASRQLGALTEG
jgi:glutamate dehydrogenase